MMRHIPLLATLLLTACQTAGESTTLFQDVGMSFEPCSQPEIKWMNQKHGFMPALRVCGSNNVAHYAWNPSGTHLYFDLTLTGQVLDASQSHKPMVTLPFDQPTGQAAWLNDQRVAVPVVPSSKDELARERIALYDIQQYVLEYKTLPDLTGITDLSRGKDPSTLFLTALDPQGVRRAWRYDVDTAQAAPAFPWLGGPVDTLSVTHQADRVTVGVNGQVTVYDLEGQSLGSWAGRRGVVHPDGRWLALEKDGDEVSVFYQRTWEDLSRREREIAERKAKQLGERFPDWYPKTVQLPTLEFIDLQGGHRGEIRSAFGTRFQWYERQDFYGSFILWGYEGKQLNRNVQLGNFALQLGSIERDRERPDLRLLGADGTPREAPPETETPTSAPASDSDEVSPGAP